MLKSLDDNTVISYSILLVRPLYLGLHSDEYNVDFLSPCLHLSYLLLIYLNSSVSYILVTS